MTQRRVAPSMHVHLVPPKSPCPTPLPPQDRYQEYRRCMAEQQLSPVRLREFFKHVEERGVPAL